MICVYRGNLPTDAHLMLHWLRRNGIAAEVRGDLLTARGELPVQESSPTVWVPDTDAEQAQKLVDEFEQPVGGDNMWTCAKCGESNEPNFGSCWNCGADHPGLKELVQAE